MPNILLGLLLLVLAVPAVAHDDLTQLSPFLGIGTSVASIPFEAEVGANEWRTGTWSLMGGMSLALGVDHEFGRAGVHLEIGPRATFFGEEEMGMGFAGAGCADVMWRPAHHILLGPSLCVEVYEPFRQGTELTGSVNVLAGITFMVPFMVGETTEVSPRLFISLAPGLHEGRVLLVPSVALGFDLDALFGPAAPL